MIDKLADIERRWEQDGIQLYQPEVINDNERYTAVMKEYRTLTPIAEKYKEYKAEKSRFDEAESILAEETDRELRDMAKEQLEESKNRMAKLSEELKILLIPKDPNDDKNIINPCKILLINILLSTIGFDASLGGIFIILAS